MKKIASLLLLISFATYSQENSLSIFEPLMGNTWKASGIWGDGSLFEQEVTFDYSLDKKVVIARSKGFTNSEQTSFGNRNLGVRKFNIDSSKVEFWEFDVFGGLTKGEVVQEEKNIIYQYDYQGYALADIWEYVNDSTYNFTVSTYENGRPGNSFLETQFRLVRPTSLVYSNKKIETTQIVNCSLKEAWSKWTTYKGLRSFFGQNNKVDIRPGGAYEIYILDSAPYGEKGGEGSTVLSFVPNKMLSFTWNAPPSIPTIRSHEHKAWVVINFDELDDGRTQVNLIHTGFLLGDDWDKTYEYFKGAWPYVLGEMAKSCN